MGDILIYTEFVTSQLMVWSSTDLPEFSAGGHTAVHHLRGVSFEEHKHLSARLGWISLFLLFWNGARWMVLSVQVVHGEGPMFPITPFPFEQPCSQRTVQMLMGARKAIPNNFFVWYVSALGYNPRAGIVKDPQTSPVSWNEAIPTQWDCCWSYKAGLSRLLKPLETRRIPQSGIHYIFFWKLIFLYQLIISHI